MTLLRSRIEIGMLGGRMQQGGILPCGIAPGKKCGASWGLEIEVSRITPSASDSAKRN